MNEPTPPASAHPAAAGRGLTNPWATYKAEQTESSMTTMAAGIIKTTPPTMIRCTSVLNLAAGDGSVFLVAVGADDNGPPPLVVPAARYPAGR